MRFGRKYIEIYVKYRGEGTPFKLVKMEDFTEIDKVPPFDHETRWKWTTDKPYRSRMRRNSVRNEHHGQPAVRKDTDNRPAGDNLKQMTRQHSEGSTKEERKKQKLSSQTSSDEDMEGSSGSGSGSGSESDTPAIRQQDENTK